MRSHREIGVFLFGHVFRRRQKVPHATEEALADSCSTFQIAVVQPGGILAIQRPRALQHHPRQRRSSHGSPLPPLRRALQQKSSPMNLAFVTARCCVAAEAATTLSNRPDSSRRQSCTARRIRPFIASRAARSKTRTLWRARWQQRTRDPEPPFVSRSSVGRTCPWSCRTPKGY